MYRFLTVHDVSLHTGLFARNRIVQQTMRICSFCHFHHRDLSKLMPHLHRCARTAATNTFALKNATEKKVKRRSKKYAELLEVRDQATCNKRAAVQTLKTADLSILVNQADITMDKLHKLKDPKFKNKFSLKSADTENVSTENTVSIHTEHYNDPGLLAASEEYFTSKYDKFDDDFKVPEEIDCNDFLDDPIRTKTTTANRVTRKSTKQKKEQQIEEERLENDNEFAVLNAYIYDMLPYMEVYLHCGLLELTENQLMTFRQKIEQFKRKPVQSVNPYNMLLKYYGSKGALSESLRIYGLIKNDLVIPDPITYANIFEAYSKHKGFKINDLQTMKEDMDKYKISSNDVFLASLRRTGLRDHVLKIIKMLEPNFKPVYPGLVTDSKCKLMADELLTAKHQSPADGLFTAKQLHNLVKKQIENECQDQVKVLSISRNTDDVKTQRENKLKLKKLHQYWEKKVNDSFEKLVDRLMKSERDNSRTKKYIHPFLQIMTKQEYVNAILNEVHEISQQSESYSKPLSVLHHDMGIRIYKRYEIFIKQQSNVLVNSVSAYMKYLNWYLNPEGGSENLKGNYRTVWQNVEHMYHMNGKPLHIDSVPWPKDLSITIGKHMYSIIINDLKIEDEVQRYFKLDTPIAAFYTLFRFGTKHWTEQIKPHPLIAQLYKDSQEEIYYSPTHMPSYIPPRPWTSPRNGGFLLSHTIFVRRKASPIKIKMNKVKLYPVFDALNELGSVPWRINSRILDLVLQIFRDGGSVKLNIPQPPSALVLPEIQPDTSKHEKARLKKLIYHYKGKKDDMYSLWCDALYKLSLANHYRDDIFWFPHNVDFRGRVYPVPPHLNHLSADMGRALLLFARGKPLGPRGLRWLKIHVINLTGFKKGKPVEEVLAYANENIENILDSARNPMTGKMWWAGAEEQWQTLAACMEIEKAMSSPNPEEYVSHFPVHQDGSCNGLQHYAALGRDEIGGQSVNLYPYDKPQDVYITVVKMIEKQRKLDAEAGGTVAKLLEGHIQRKVIKQTVMTTVYGVTKHGARFQILRKLRERKDFPLEHSWGACLYLTNSTFSSLRTMFTSAREIQDWLTECANIISRICSEYVEWVTPLGFLVVQDYIKDEKIPFYKDPINPKPDTLKQRNAFPPNFIHSLDSTHMMLTALYSANANITFVSVHDCFWTHACDVDSMNKICREQFVALHSEPILQDLSKYFIERFLISGNGASLDKDTQDYMLKSFSRVPEHGDLDIQKVLLSTYFFS